ncbi:MAG: mechanosensitive ion channel family protein [Candidatus Harrisonbacteria bacterium CG10_big_fil_rev_8_21_14_0_10_49_15]|uniref:Mechanosensitive ion channel family protein n=1 Tax=Candidatus Harrisonbacteria bacterium CG10_big_fil_rev_8_21_14_0_10_49_15 TaxID=1974587 RepID=A0A2H0ULY0_9BACT|nr:MAG: mechanosensitive ion channel family protein [Candidatus Harrisonbacteria bacterium CG10_big_fil_rev_8_21_14_0_10_49_15]
MNTFQERVAEFSAVIMPWLLNSGIKIIAILIIAAIIVRVSRIFIEKGVRKIVRQHDDVSKIAERQREDTLIKVFANASKVILWVVAAMMVLSEAGIDIGPLIAAAGVIGIAFGFGGQYLIKDIIAGFFVILENQYRVGDVVTIAGISGKVEDITLRLTVLRDLNGTQHHVPNGEISTASNMTKQYASVNMTIGIGYSSKLDHVISVVNRVGKALAESPEWKERIIKAPEFLRIDEFGDSSINIKILGDTIPGQQWAVAGELRKQLKEAFDEQGIEIPFPQRVVHQAQKD